MKKCIAFVVSWALFVSGDLVSRLMHRCEQAGRLYPIYNWLMIKSTDMQDWGGNASPWGKIQSLEGVNDAQQ